MNEHIDIAFTGAKIATHDNEVASTTVHGLSALYNIGQMARYRVMYFQEQYVIMNGGSAKSTIISEQYYREMWKHSVLAGIDILSLLIKGFLGLGVVDRILMIYVSIVIMISQIEERSQKLFEWYMGSWGRGAGARNIPIGQCHTVRVLESGTMIMDFHQSREDKCHRMINAVESGTGSIATPIEAQKSGANPSDKARTHRQNRINILDAAAIKGWLLTESN